MPLEHKEFDLSPTGLTRVLTEYGLAIEQIKEYERIQNGSIVKMAERTQRMENKLDDMNAKFAEMSVKILEWKDELKTHINDAIEKNNDKRDLNIRQRVTWIVGLILGIPSTIWAFVQLVSFLAKK